MRLNYASAFCGTLIRDEYISSVIDLRLSDDEAGPLAASEQALVESADVHYLHVPLFGSHMPAQDEMKTLLAAFDAAEPPILVHCMGGAHRSGLASALWLIDKENESPILAARQLSECYGFFLWERKLKGFFSGKPTIDQILWDYRDAYRQKPQRFRQWLKRSYSPRM